MKLRRVTIALITLILIQTAFFTAVIIGEKQERKSDALKTASNMASVISSATKIFFNQYLAIFNTLKSIDQIVQQDSDSSKEIIGRLNHKYPEIVNFAAVNKNGYFFVSGEPIPNDKTPNIKHLEFFQRIRSGEKLVIMQPHIGPISNEFVTGVVVPLEDENGQFNGLIGVSIKFQKLIDRWQSLLSSSDSLLAVYDEKGQIYFSPSAFEEINGPPLIGILSGESETIQLGNLAYVIHTIIDSDSKWHFSLLVPIHSNVIDLITSRKELIFPFILIIITIATLGLWYYQERQWVEKFRHVFETANVGKSITQLNGKISVNQTLASMLDYTTNELSDKTWQDLTPIDEIQSNEAFIAPLVSGEKDSARFKKRYIRKDGSHVWADVSTAIQRDESGTPLYFITTIVDISEQVQTQEQLRLSEERFSNAFHVGPAGMTITRIADGKFVEINDAFLKMFEFEREEVVGHTSTQLNMLSLEEREKLIKKQLESEGLTDFELEARAKSGRIVNILFSSKQMELEGESHHITTMVDITEHKIAEQKIMHLNNVLRAIRAVNQLIVHEKDREKLIREGCRLLVENRGYQTALIILTDHMGQPDIWREAGFGPIFEDYSQYLERGELPSCCNGVLNEVQVIQDREITCNDCYFSQNYRSLDVMCVALIFDKKTYGYMIVTLKRGLANSPEEKSLFLEIANDISFALNHIQDEINLGKLERERKELEKQLTHMQTMESIGNLAGGIAHDFNNILSSVIGFTELALDGVEKNSITEDNLLEVYAAGNRAKKLVSQILAFARQSKEEVKPIQVDTIINEVLKFIRSSIPTTIEIVKNIDSDSLIMGNSTQVHQIIMNLCTNAAHAMENNGGILDVSLKDIFIDGNSDHKNLGKIYGHYIEITVSDTGTGIAPEIIDSIFKPYFTTKGIGEGTGMGLAMVHGIVESYGGKILVNSTLGQGTTFTVYLPVARKRNMLNDHETEQVPTGTERILLIDDEASITKMGSKSLERLGYQVTSTTSSEKALEIFRSSKDIFDLVITDMTMPNLTGDKLALELKKIKPEIPIILCTGYSKKITSESAAIIGINEIVHKPFIKAELAKTIRKVLNKANDTV